MHVVASGSRMLDIPRGRYVRCIDSELTCTLGVSIHGEAVFTNIDFVVSNSPPFWGGEAVFTTVDFVVSNSPEAMQL